MIACQVKQINDIDDTVIQPIILKNHMLKQKQPFESKLRSTCYIFMIRKRFIIWAITCKVATSSKRYIKLNKDINMMNLI